MLKRRSKIQQYISNLKKKQIKKTSLKNHSILKHKIEIDANQQVPKIQTHHQPTLNVQIQIQQQNQQQKPCWYDQHDNNQQNQQIQLNQKNKFRKLTNFGMNNKTNVQEYEKKIGKFYQARYKRINWAQQHQNIQQKDVNDYLNQDIYFSDKRPANKTIKFYAKSSQKHESIISGLDWHKSILFTCGLDHKLKVFHFQPNQTNPQLKLKQQKDIYMTDLPLSNCYYRQNGLLMGTLRKNIVLVDTQKWKPTFITSSFLKDHKTYQNLRISKINNQSCIFSDNKISILDKNNVYVGSLLANQPIQDVCFSVANNNTIYAVTNDSIYQWDIRKLQIIKTVKKYLSFTTITATPDSINIGSKLGTVYIYSNNFENPLQNNNLLTHITKVSANKTGNLTIALSKWKNNAIRVIDSLTGKSIGQWPGVKTKIGLPMQAGFGDQDYFGVGNSQGYVSVYGFNNQII